METTLFSFDVWCMIGVYLNALEHGVLLSLNSDLANLLSSERYYRYYVTEHLSKAYVEYIKSEKEDKRPDVWKKGYQQFHLNAAFQFLAKQSRIEHRCYPVNYFDAGDTIMRHPNPYRLAYTQYEKKIVAVPPSPLLWRTGVQVSPAYSADKCSEVIAIYQGGVLQWDNNKLLPKEILATSQKKGFERFASLPYYKHAMAQDGSKCFVHLDYPFVTLSLGDQTYAYYQAGKDFYLHDIKTKKKYKIEVGDSNGTPQYINGCLITTSKMNASSTFMDIYVCGHPEQQKKYRVKLSKAQQKLDIAHVMMDRSKMPRLIDEASQNPIQQLFFWVKAIANSVETCLEWNDGKPKSFTKVYAAAPLIEENANKILSFSDYLLFRGRLKSTLFHRRRSHKIISLSPGILRKGNWTSWRNQAKIFGPAFLVQGPAAFVMDEGHWILGTN